MKPKMNHILNLHKTIPNKDRYREGKPYGSFNNVLSITGFNEKA